MKHCINCKYIGFSGSIKGDPEKDSVCLHDLAKVGMPSVVMGRQVYKYCYEMRSHAGDCKVEASLFNPKPKDKVDE